MTDRAVLFVDGNNFYHSLREEGVRAIGNVSLAKVSAKIMAPRTWVATNYYVGQVSQHGNTRLYADQRTYVARQQAADSRVKFKFGRLEPRTTTNELAEVLGAYLASLTVRIDQSVFQHLQGLVRQHRTSVVQVEKAVDVMLAVDLVVMAERQEFDAAYVLSADGDYTHAVEFVRSLGKKVYAVSPRKGAQLAAAVNSYIPTRRAWYDDCYLDK